MEFDNVDVTVGQRRIVHGVSLDIPEGGFTAVVGPNGCGKSTLLRSLYRVLRPSRGVVRVGDADVWRTPPREVARWLAVMAQETPSDFDLTVADVVLLGRIPHQRGFGGDGPRDVAIARRALHRVGADHLERRSFAPLSGGEKQRVLLARALTQHSPVLVLDEPTNHLDLAFQLELMRIIAAVDATTVAALHDLNLAIAHCDRVAVMKNGCLVAQGVPEDVLTVGLIDEVFGVRAHRLTHPQTGGLLIAFSPSQHSTQSREELI